MLTLVVSIIKSRSERLEHHWDYTC